MNMEMLFSNVKWISHNSLIRAKLAIIHLALHLSNELMAKKATTTTTERMQK